MDETEETLAPETVSPESVEKNNSFSDTGEAYSKRIKRYTILTSDDTLKFLNTSAWSWPIILTFTVSIVLAATAIYLNILLLLAGTLALLGTVGAWLAYSAYNNGIGIRDYLKDCEIEFAELSNLRVDLFTFLNETDERTSRYFHCIPHDLLTVYYRLRQIETQLTTILNEADYLCGLKSKGAALRVLNILKSAFRYHDSMSINTGTEYQIALYAVPKTVQELVETLEAKLAALEADLAVTVVEEAPEESCPKEVKPEPPKE
jgi:hypothetical protein